MATAMEPAGEVKYTGIDITENKGSINFADVRAAGKNAVYIRSGIGRTYINPRLDQYHDDAKLAGLATGFYHTMTAEDADEARREARFFVDVIRGLYQDLRPAMVPGVQISGMTRAQANELASAFLDEVASYGEKIPAILTSAEAASAVWSSDLAAKYPLWTIDHGAPAPEAGTTWSGWSGWQYADDGEVAGIEGDTNLDYFTDNMENADPTPLTGDATRVVERARKLICITVRWGDTLSAYARRYGTTVNSIVRLNSIRNPNLIYPGQRFYIDAANPGSNPCCDSYTIQRGDTLTRIAYRFGTTVAHLAAVNEIQNPDLIYADDVIRLGFC